MATMQLEFAQAMADFKKMFPDMDRDVIECVLRANQGAVDQTIDQLLAMSSDNQNEKLRNEFETTATATVTSATTTTTATAVAAVPAFTGLQSKFKDDGVLLQGLVPPETGTTVNTGASPKVKKTGTKRWNPPMLGPLPPTFLRLAPSEKKPDYDLPDEQFAMMLQNEEFMNELKWNQEFMMALDIEQQAGKQRSEDDAVFKERLKHMGKKSRKKFLQLARVFTWQKNKKPSAVRHPDSLLLQEDPSDDEEMPRRGKK